MELPAIPVLPRGLRRLRSLRVRAVVVVVVVGLLPLLLVVLVNMNEEAADERLSKNTAAAVVEAAALATLDAQAVAQAVDAIAFRRRVRLRVVDTAGAVVVDVDREAGTGVLFAAGTLFFGPDGAPSLAAFERTLPPVAERPEVDAARASKQVERRCGLVADRRLLVCSAALVVPGADHRGDVIVHSVESSRRAVRSLYDVRYQLLKLLLGSLPAALILAWWLGWRMVRPLERLRHQMIARAGAPSPAPVDVDRADEFGDLATAFNDLLTRLQDRRRQSAELIADLAHEFKNPVAVARAAAEQLEGPVDAARTARLAAVIGDSAARLDALVTEFLQLARAEAGLEGDAREDVDVKALATALADRARSDVRNDAANAGVGGVDVVVSGDAAVVAAVPLQLERALHNLIDNAVSFAGQGSGQNPKENGRAGRVDIAVRVEGINVVVDVTDDGPGIAAADLPRVFERYFTTRAMKHGTGLGLALARAIVEAHGGSVSARSPVRSDVDGAGPGAVFTVRLPLRR